ncbi:MAG: phospholipase D-like domain-containing protein [Chthoniobacterales bacterium]
MLKLPLAWMKYIALGMAGGLLSACTHGPGFSRPLPSVTGVHDIAFRQTLSALLDNSVLEGNQIRTLNNGDEIFPAMLADIRSARKSINLETFIFDQGVIPEQFVDALSAKARAGVHVRVILDALGASMSFPYHRQLRDSGVELALYHRIWWPDLQRYNHRTHRKLLVIDGTVGFIGGAGISDVWRGRASRPEEWRDVQYRAEGPVVTQLQGAFLNNWLKMKREVLQGRDYFPALKKAGPFAAQVFYSSPRHQRYSAELMYHLAIASARHTLRLTNPYFLPDRELTDALCAAAQRGVLVQILMPGKHNDQPAVKRASRRRWAKLLAAGVQLYEYQPTMLHSKLLVVDDYFVSIGSTNLDPRSLRLNDEANMNIFNTTFAASQVVLFKTDLRKSTPVTIKSNKQPMSAAEALLQTAETPLEPQL